MNLPTEVRYRPYADWTDEEKTKIRENVAKSPWRASYHIEPETGLLNDPNGFSYFNGKFQLFYQSWPFGAAHGLKQWVHTETEDLVHFTETGVKLLPDHENDSHGAYSGSAYQIGDKLQFSLNYEALSQSMYMKNLTKLYSSDSKIESLVQNFDMPIYSQC